MSVSIMIDLEEPSSPILYKPLGVNVSDILFSVSLCTFCA